MDGWMGGDALTNTKKKEWELWCLIILLSLPASVHVRDVRIRSVFRIAHLSEYTHGDVADKKYLHIKRIYKLTRLKKKQPKGCIKTVWQEIHMEVWIIVVIWCLSIKKWCCAPALFWASSTLAVIPGA